MFPFPPSKWVTWDFPLLSWAPMARTLCPPQDPATLPATSPTPSHQLLLAAISLGKTWPHSFQRSMKLALVSWGKNTFLCPGFPIRQPFYCSPPSWIFFCSLIRLQRALCCFQRRTVSVALSNPVMQMELPGVQGKPRTALGYLLHALRDALTLCQTEGAWVHLQPSTGLNPHVSWVSSAQSQPKLQPGRLWGRLPAQRSHSLIIFSPRISKSPSF